MRKIYGSMRDEGLTFKEAADTIYGKILGLTITLNGRLKPTNPLNSHHIINRPNDLFKRALDVLAVERR